MIVIVYNHVTNVLPVQLVGCIIYNCVWCSLVPAPNTTKCDVAIKKYEAGTQFESKALDFPVDIWLLSKRVSSCT